MEALRYAMKNELYCSVTQSQFAQRRSNPVTVFSARLADDTGRVEVKTKNSRTDDLIYQLQKTKPGVDGECTAEGRMARNHQRSGIALELISLPRIGENGDPVGLDRESLFEVYEYLDLDPWLLGQLCRRSSGWTCCTYATGILNFQLMTSMYYIAWSVNTALGSTKTKAILIAREHIVFSRWFSSETLIMQLLETSIINPEDPFSLANAVLLDIISYMERELDAQWKAEIWIENLTGHGVFGYRHREKISSLDTQYLAFAAKEMGICNGIGSYSTRLAEVAERMVSDLEDEVQKFHTTVQEGQSTSFRENCWTGHSSMIQSLNSNKKRIWNFKVDAKDLDNRVKAQSNTTFSLISNRHAEASRRDSGSMKTVAVMTMVFLPGTFLAALFAVPSLDWSGPKVITGNFWVYWAFTIPTTLLVFVAWMILSLDRPVIRLVGRAVAKFNMSRHD